MYLVNDLPTDSVLRRHALAERSRELGLPPTDSVLRRHYEHLLASLTPAAAVAAAPAAAPVRASAPAPAQAAPRASATVQPQPAARASTPSPSSGGLFGWLRRLFGN